MDKVQNKEVGNIRPSPKTFREEQMCFGKMEHRRTFTTQQHHSSIDNSLITESSVDDILWPARSPDLIPLEYFLKRFVKDQAYVPALPANVVNLKLRLR
jgi:hypothetical protein